MFGAERLARGSNRIELVCLTPTEPWGPFRTKHFDDLLAYAGRVRGRTCAEATGAFDRPAPTSWCVGVGEVDQSYLAELFPSAILRWW
ncbi:hypothetical protein GCM10023094_13570 [Rhodococcus olei]|uniref:Uncharacterized protein n=1 Tax=Rhodococcus olei TaxID=2161675 RepID=A0ABP8NZB0_9NOCA